MKKIFKRLIILALIMVIGLGIFVFVINYKVVKYARRYMLSENAVDKYNYDAAVVLGASVKKDKTPSLMLQDRLDKAVVLYTNGVVKKVIMTGDHIDDYYNEVNESYYNIRQYLNESFTNIYDKINNCINKTYETLINEYKKLSEEEESINKEYSKKENSQEKKTSFDIEGKQYTIKATITEMESYAQFTLDLLFENNNYRYPKLVANITNKSRPKKMNVKIEPRYDDCGKGTTIEAIFDDANYKMNLNFDTKSENINVNTITNYEKYEYNIEIYEMEEEEERICFVVAYIKFCLDNTKCKDKTILSNQKLYFDKKELIEKDFIEY